MTETQHCILWGSWGFKVRLSRLCGIYFTQIPNSTQRKSHVLRFFSSIDRTLSYYVFTGKPVMIFNKIFEFIPQDIKSSIWELLSICLVPCFDVCISYCWPLLSLVIRYCTISFKRKSYFHNLIMQYDKPSKF